MPFQLLDIILAGTVIISALLALSRGFTREALSLIAWGAAALAAAGAIFNPAIMKLARGYLQPDIVATVGVGAGAFILVLVVVSLIGTRIADWVLDSAAGPIDRTAGLVYGMVRGLLLVVVAYLFYIWLVPIEKREEWVRQAWSLSIIESTAQMAIGFLPQDTGNMLREKMLPPPAKETEALNEGYSSSQTNGMNQLIQGNDAAGTASGSGAAANGQSTAQ